MRYFSPEGLNNINGLEVDVASVETNIIYFDITGGSKSASKLCKILEESGITMMPDRESRIRVVIHHRISANDVQYTLPCIQLVGLH